MSEEFSEKSSSYICCDRNIYMKIWRFINETNKNCIIFLLLFTAMLIKPVACVTVCANVAENTVATITCTAGSVVTSIDFASYGTPTGLCPSFSVGSCNSGASVSTVSSSCVGKATCSVTASNAAFGGDPCGGTLKSLAIVTTCSLTLTPTSLPISFKPTLPTIIPTFSPMIPACVCWLCNSVIAYQSGPNSVTLEWTPNCNGQLWNGAGSWAADGAVSPFVLTGLTVGATYSWSLRGTADWVWTSNSVTIMISPLPTVRPSSAPTTLPSKLPSNQPTALPTTTPSIKPSAIPSAMPSMTPSVSPSTVPSMIPSVKPSTIPSLTPSINPSTIPSINPSAVPSVRPSTIPSLTPSISPSVSPSVVPTIPPSSLPTFIPSTPPSSFPTSIPSLTPSASPTCAISFCQQGQYSQSPSSGVCIACPNGQFASFRDQTSCSPCPSGTYNNIYSQGALSMCVPCPAGKYTSELIGASACVSCPSGKYADSGATNCSLCLPGTYTPSPGLPACWPCLPGTSSVSGASVCQSCYVNSPSSAFVFNCSLH